MRRWLFALLLPACVQAPEDEGGCPCAAPLQCCAETDRCIPEGEACPRFDAGRAPPAPTVSVKPDRGPAAGQVSITVSTQPAAEVLGVRVGLAPCPIAAVETDGVVCVLPRNSRAVAPVDVSVDLVGGEVRVAPAAFTYEQPVLVDITEVSGLAGTGPATGVLATDLDQDGHLDLVLAGASAPGSYAHNGALAFAAGAGASATGPTFWVDVGAGPALRTVESLGLNARDEPIVGAWLDADGDGAVDVFGARSQGGRAAPEWSRTFVLGQGRGDDFTEVPVAFAPDAAAAAPAINALALIDHDGDGDADVVACGDQLWLFTNEGGRFVDHSDRLGAPIRGPCGDVTVADFDGDGRDDLAWVPRVTFAEDVPEQIRSGTTVLLNDGVNLSAAAELELAGELSGCIALREPGATLPLGRSVVVALDIDNDGDVDLFLPTPFGPCAGPAGWYENQLAQGFSSWVFRTAARSAPTVQANAALPVDLDRDGDLDIVDTADGPHERTHLWRNSSVEGGSGSGLVVHLADAARRGWGAVVEVAGQRRIVGASTRSQGDLSVHFGLGDAAAPYPIRVRWPDGQISEQVADRPGAVTVTDP